MSMTENTRDMRWHVFRNPSYMSTDFVLEGRNGAYGIPTTITVHEPPQGDQGHVREPTLRLDMDMAQQLFQAMWDQGFRPEGGQVVDSTLAAKDAHIELAERMLVKADLI